MKKNKLKIVGLYGLGFLTAASLIKCSLIPDEHNNKQYNYSQTSDVLDPYTQEKLEDIIRETRLNLLVQDNLVKQDVERIYSDNLIYFRGTDEEKFSKGFDLINKYAKSKFKPSEPYYIDLLRRVSAYGNLLSLLDYESEVKVNKNNQDLQPYLFLYTNTDTIPIHMYGTNMEDSVNKAKFLVGKYKNNDFTTLRKYGEK